MAGPIETKAYAAPSATLIITQAAALVFIFWPAAAKAVTPDERLQIISFAATVFTAVVAYWAPHTFRPDLLQPEVASSAPVVAAPVVAAPAAEEAPSGDPGVADAGRGQ